MYATLAEAKAELNADLTTDDASLLFLVRMVGARIDNLMSSPVPLFEPYIEAREFEITSVNVDSRRNVFILPPTDTLIELTGVTLGGSAITSVAAYPATRVPIHMIRRTDDCSWYTNGTGDPLTTVISGMWGYHRRYSGAWLAVDALAAAIVARLRPRSRWPMWTARTRADTARASAPETCC